MKSMLLLISVAASLFGQSAYGGYFTASPELKKALDYGADTKVVFKIVDDQGMPVANALVDVTFSLNGKGTDVCKRTPSIGCVELRGQSVGEVVYTILKEGYYATFGTLLLRDFSRQDSLIRNGRWQPYGAPYTFTLKPRKHPIPMEVCRFRRNGVVTNTPIGFDLVAGDFVGPHGKGKTADFTLTLTGTTASIFRFQSRLVLSFTNALDGAYLMEKDRFSDYVSVYRADTNAVYRRQFTFDYDSLNPTNRIDTSLPENQYLVMRTRTRVNERNELVEANYSKLYGRLSFTPLGISFRAYFNPVSNDTNLEFEQESIIRRIDPARRGQN